MRTHTHRARRQRTSIVSTSAELRARELVENDMPEWMTEYWKHTVEAEARVRLGRSLRGIAHKK